MCVMYTIPRKERKVIPNLDSLLFGHFVCLEHLYIMHKTLCDDKRDQNIILDLLSKFRDTYIHTYIDTNEQ